MADEAHEDNKQSEEVLPNAADHPRNKRLMEIAAAEEQHKKDGVEFVDVADEDHGKSVPVDEDVPAEEEEAPAAAAAPQKFKITANGVEEELTLDEMRKRAELASGAEAKFQEAARLRREAEEIASRAAQPSQAAPAQPSVEDDDRALARALQMGSEEEAAGVIKRIRSQAVQPGQIAGMVEMVTSGNWFRQEYPEIFADPWLTKIALDEDERLVKSGDRRSYKDRYKAIGDKLREWKGTQAAAVQAKVERKANLQVVPKANVRASSVGAEGDDNKSDEQVHKEFIAAEAKRRGQQFVR